MINILDEFVRKLKSKYYEKTYFPKILPSLENVEKYGTARQATDECIIWHRRDVICVLSN